MREGSRWVDERPSPDEVVNWFKTQPLHDGMDHEPYVGGIVLIGSKEKVLHAREKNDGSSIVVEGERPVWTPYVKVDTRIAYFRDFARSLGEDYVGVIEPVEVPRITDKTNWFYNEHFPPGFTVHAVRQTQDRSTRYVVATWRAAIYKRAELIGGYTEIESPRSWTAPPHQREPSTIVRPNAVPILQGIGSKQVPMMRQYPDDAALMKAETGAIGRALGVAGILVVGTGVASAEDMQEALTEAPSSPVAAEPALPGEAATTAAATAGTTPPSDAVQPEPENEDVQLRTLAMQLKAELEKDHPEAWKRYSDWYTNERKFPPLAELSGPQLRGAVRKLEQEVAEARGV